ncbi:proline-rich membrane anchor 1-like isoform X1 [Acipenser ruthenus]|uniref:proline-rich membrane anchor 1-like isoform X1 n=1 Tax=Acipenser ruthenus TaxID=7906 RepID=UPI00145B01E2|nr:proline-rich membrane anchor 1-like isoform X1 [Acipenser ruthenus]
MLVRDLLLLSLSSWPFFLGHVFLTSFLLLFQFTQGELQKSCQRTIAEKVTESCQQICQCRPYPPLPPPPPPPPPPRLLALATAESTVPLLKPWWKEIVVVGTVGCATLVFLLVMVIICYKAIKRKPLRKEENGTSRGEYAMASRNKKRVDANNAVV